MKKVKIKELPSILNEAYMQWVDDKALKLAASLSFYSILSLVPLLAIIVSIAGFFIGEKTATESIISQIQDLIGEKGASLFRELAGYSFFNKSGFLPTIISGIVLIVGSLGVFVELKESMNIIWGIEIKPGKGLKLFFKNRLLTFPIIFAIGFLLIISLVASAVLNFLSNFVNETLAEIIPVLQITDLIISVVGLTLLFAVIFRYLPDAKIGWGYVWQGALFTSVLFNIGKFLIGIYLGNTYYGNVYGAAGSVVILIIWIYYSSIIFFFGAEFTYVIRTKNSDEKLKTKKDFIRVKKITTQIDDVMKEKKNS